MATSYKGITVSFGADTSKLGAALREIDTKSKETSKSIKEINSALKFDGNNIGLLSKKFSALHEQIDLTEQRLKTLKNEKKNVDNAFAGKEMTDEQAEHYKNLQNEIMRTETRLNSFKKQAKQTAETIRTDFNKAVNDLKTTISGAVKVITAAETALVAFSAKAVSTGMTFDKAMSNVEAISGATADEMEVLRNKAQEMGADTVYSASEAAEALSYMALAGWDTQSMLEGISPVLDLAAASAMDLGTASDIVTDYLTAFGLEASDAANFVDIMAYAMSNSNTTTSQLGEAYKNCAATSASLGYSVEETTAVLMAMSNAGVKGGEAGTALNAVMTRLATDTKDCATALAEYGVNVYDANGNMNSLSSILEGMSDVWDDLSDAEQANLAKTIAGTSHYSALQTIMTGCSETAKESGQSFSDYAAALGDCAGAAENMSEIMVDNLQGDLTILKSAVEGLQIAISDKLTPSLRNSANIGIEAVNDLTESVENGKLSKTFEEFGESLTKLINNGVTSAAQVLPLVIKLLAGVMEHLDTILSIMTAIKVASGAKAIITNIVNIGNAIKNLTTTIEAAKTAQEAFNIATTANGIAAIATGIGVIAGVLLKLKLSANDTADETEKFSEEIQNAIDKSKELAETLEESKKAREDNIKAIESEYGGYKKLVDQLYTMAESENKTVESKNAMLSIINQLNEKIPGLNLNYDETTEKLSMQREALEKLIDKTMTYYKVQAAQETLSSIGTQQFEVEKQLTELEEQRLDAVKQYNSINNVYGTKISALKSSLKSYNNLQVSTQITKYQMEIDKAKAPLDAINEEIEALRTKQTELQDEFDSTTQYINDNTASVSNLSEAIRDNAELVSEDINATEDLSETEETLAEKFDKAKSAVSTTRSELSEYLNLLKEVNNNTKYSTAQILELIEKYPELAGAIRLTSDGYTLEKEAVEELVKAKSAKLEQDALESLNLAEKNYWDIAKSGHATSAEEETAYNAWKQAKNTYNEMKKVTSSINSGDIVYSTNPSSTENSDTTDYWKQAAENEIAEAEHLYNMGEISAEEYYDKLADINRRYYENKAEYLNEYNELAEKVYSGLKKAQEDDISNAKTLEERIRAVQEAQTKLKNADKQEVSVYSSAAGFHSEKNTSAIIEAQQSLYDAKYDLAETLLKLGKFDGSSISSQIGSLNISKLQNMLPDLSRLSIPTSANAVTQQNSPQTPKEYNITVNYTSGDIILQGAVDEITVARVKRLMQSEFKELFLKCMTEYLNQANLERMTGG